MNAVLNGTGWGEAPEKELEIPYFMKGGYIDRERWESNCNEARIAEAVGRERRKARIAAYHKRNSKLCLVGLTATVALLMIVGVIWG